MRSRGTCFNLFFPKIPELSFHTLRTFDHGRNERPREGTMFEDFTGLAAVVMFFAVPLAAISFYTFYRVRKLRSEERMAALARGVNVPMEPDLSEIARSRRSGILLVSGAIGYMATFGLIARVQPDMWVAASFGIIPLALGAGFFVDSALVRKDLHG
jgi:hypothetical protein